jgi:Flp pilus assembly protein TadG
MIKRLNDESGQTLIVVALGLTVITGVIAFATDVGVQLREKRLAQVAADAAAISGAQQLLTSATGTTLANNIQAAGQAAAARNGFSATTYQSPVYSTTYAGDAGYVESVVTQSTPTSFMNIFGIGSLTVSARAVARLGNSTNCIYALSTAGTSAAPAITIDNTGKIDTDVTPPGCAIMDNSNIDVDDDNGTGSCPAGGGGQILAQAVGVGSTNSSCVLPGAVTPAPAYGIAPVGDPLAYLTPPPYSSSTSCTAPPAGANNAYTGNGSVTIGPSGDGTVCWTSMNIGNGMKVSLNPGVYIITGALSIQGGTTVTGSGVTFYFPTTGGSINIANGTTVNLSAPTSGAYSGMLFWQESGDTNALVIAGGSTENLEGIVYAPSAALDISNDGTTGVQLDVVASTISVTSSGELENYQFASGQPNPFKAIQLVE